MGNRARVGFIAGAGIGAAAAAALRRRWSGSGERSREDAPGPGPLGRSFLERLAEAVRIPTVTHQEWDLVDEGQLTRFRAFLSEAYPGVHEHLEHEVVGGNSILYRWPGADPGSPPVLLMGHYDVVPIEPGTEDDWPHPPFAAVDDGTHLWGRGALDDKGPVIALFEAVESLLAEGFRPRSTVYLSTGHDEEVGGSRGAGAVAALLAERGVRPSFVLDEGGAVVEDLLGGASAPVALIGIGEKGYVDVEIAAEGAGGHSSTPPPTTAVGMVAAAVTALEANPMPARVEVQAGLLRALAAVLPLPQRLVLRRPDRFRRIIERRLSAHPATAATIRTTAAATIVEGGVKSNVLPQQARAVVNFRILHGDTIEGVLAHVRSVVPRGVTVRALEGGFKAEPSPLSDPGSEAFGLVAAAAAETFPGTMPAPWILMGATDSRYFASLAGEVLRFAPFRLTPADMNRVHGTGERIRVADAERAVGFYRLLIRTACGAG